MVLLGYQAAACLPLLKDSWRRHVESAARFYSSKWRFRGHAGHQADLEKPSFVGGRWVLFELDFFVTFFFLGGGSEKNKIRFLRVPDYDSMINMNHMIWLYGCFLFGSGYLWPMALENFHFNLWMFQLDDHPGSRFFSWLNLRSANKTPCWKHAWGNLSLHLKRKDRQLEGSTENFWWKFMEISDGPRAPRFQ